jgi:hypothetical protein
MKVTMPFGLFGGTRISSATRNRIWPGHFPGFWAQIGRANGPEPWDRLPFQPRAASRSLESPPDWEDSDA